MVDLGDGRFARATVELRPHSRTQRIHAYLRWSDRRRSHTKHLGEVDHSTRVANLAEAWQRARMNELLADKKSPDDSWASSREVRASMQGNRGKDTRPELRLRALLHARGLRYRVSARPLPGVRRTVDVAFPKARVAVFVDGCFWHGCPEHHRPATKNSEFWQRKIAGNKQRDAETNQLLDEAGWAVIRAWEHEDPAEVAEHVAKVVSDRQTLPRAH